MPYKRSLDRLLPFAFLKQIYIDKCVAKLFIVFPQYAKYSQRGLLNCGLLNSIAITHDIML